MQATDPAEDRPALLAFVLAGGPLAPRRRLLARYRDAAAALAAGPPAWRNACCTPAQVAALARPDAAIRGTALQWLRAAPDRHLLAWHDAGYPPLLRQVAQPPLALFVEGEPALLRHPSVAVVGSRRPTAGGRDHAGHFAQSLAGAGLAVGSGLAAGVDAAAHEAVLALPDGLTYAVLGTGPDQAYPRQHRGLRDRIAGQGAVLSEYPPGTGPLRGHFPARNRILAGLSLGTLVIEAAQRSGALITARLAAEAGREAFALPGSIHNPMARGCHRLIRDGAQLVETPEEVLAVLGPLAARLGGDLRVATSIPIQGQANPPGKPADPDYQTLWRALGHDPSPMDSLIQRTGLTAARLSSMLLAMELEGRVVAEHGRYTRNP